MSWSIYVAPYNPVFVANNYMQDTHVPKPAFTHVCVCVSVFVCGWEWGEVKSVQKHVCIYIYNLI